MATVYQCGDVSQPYRSNEHRKAMHARIAKQASTVLAMSDAADLRFTSKGDFTHLAPTGHLTTVYLHN